MHFIFKFYFFEILYMSMEFISFPSPSLPSPFLPMSPYTSQIHVLFFNYYLYMLSYTYMLHVALATLPKLWELVALPALAKENIGSMDENHRHTHYPISTCLLGSTDGCFQSTMTSMSFPILLPPHL